MRPLEGGYLANNIGRFRIFENLSEGWKPVMIESRVREVGIPETHVMTGPRHQLVMAENMMFNVATELFIEGRFAYGLWYAEPEILRVWTAIGNTTASSPPRSSIIAAHTRWPAWPSCSTIGAKAKRFSTDWRAATCSTTCSMSTN